MERPINLEEQWRVAVSHVSNSDFWTLHSSIGELLTADRFEGLPGGGDGDGYLFFSVGGAHEGGFELDGGSQMPWLSMALWKRPNAAVSDLAASS